MVAKISSLPFLKSSVTSYVKATGTSSLDFFDGCSSKVCSPFDVSVALVGLVVPVFQTK